MIEFINENTKKEYEDFIASHPKGHFAQSHLWGRQKSAWEFKAIAVRDSDGKIKGSMAFLIRRAPLFGCSMMYSCRGPVCDLDDEDTFSRLLVGAKILAKRCNAYVIKIDPDVPAENADFAAMLERHGFKCVSRGKSFEGSRSLSSACILMRAWTRPSCSSPFRKRHAIICARLKKAGLR